MQGLGLIIISRKIIINEKGSKLREINTTTRFHNQDPLSSRAVFFQIESWSSLIFQRSCLSTAFLFIHHYQVHGDSVLKEKWRKRISGREISWMVLQKSWICQCKDRFHSDILSLIVSTMFHHRVKHIDIVIQNFARDPNNSNRNMFAGYWISLFQVRTGNSAMKPRDKI